MKSQQYITQPTNVGVPRALSEAAQQHIICLLRIIEALPLISESSESNCGVDDDTLILRRLEIIHKNHLELSTTASLVLIDGVC